jgi:hypothetical protein
MQATVLHWRGEARAGGVVRPGVWRAVSEIEADDVVASEAIDQETRPIGAYDQSKVWAEQVATRWNELIHGSPIGPVVAEHRARGVSDIRDQQVRGWAQASFKHVELGTPVALALPERVSLTKTPA